MGSPSAVITMGLGSWGSVNELLTLGYGSGEESDTSPVARATVAGTDRSRPTVAGTDRSRATVTGTLRN
jgi:hypothetical protein